MNRPRLILASASPRRRDLLTWAGLSFEVRPADVDEGVRPDEDPVGYARRLAADKAEAVAADCPGEWVLSADTVVALDGRIMGKPENRDDAADMLGRLSGRVHQVVTGFCLMNADLGRRRVGHVLTNVEFRTLSEPDIRAYIDSGEVWDKAGAYAIQGRGAFLCRRLDGSYTNVIGLPLAEILEAMKDLGARSYPPRNLDQTVRRRIE